MRKSWRAMRREEHRRALHLARVWHVQQASREHPSLPRLARFALPDHALADWKLGTTFDVAEHVCTESEIRAAHVRLRVKYPAERPMPRRNARVASYAWR